MSPVRDGAVRATRYRSRTPLSGRTAATAALWALLAAAWAGAVAHAIGRFFPPAEPALPALVGGVVGGCLVPVIRRLRLSRPRV